jgi:hypothetical protein
MRQACANNEVILVERVSSATGDEKLGAPLIEFPRLIVGIQGRCENSS